MKKIAISIGVALTTWAAIIVMFEVALKRYDPKTPTEALVGTFFLPADLFLQAIGQPTELTPSDLRQRFADTLGIDLYDSGQSVEFDEHGRANVLTVADESVEFSLDGEFSREIFAALECFALASEANVPDEEKRLIIHSVREFKRVALPELPADDAPETTELFGSREFWFGFMYGIVHGVVQNTLRDRYLEMEGALDPGPLYETWAKEEFNTKDCRSIGD